MDHTAENEQIIKECNELVSQLLEKATDDERGMLQDASLDYKLVYFAKKGMKSNDPQKNRNATTAIDALFELNKGLRIKQQNYLQNMLKKSNFSLTEIDFTERDKEALIDALEKVDLSKISNKKTGRKRYEYEQKLFWNETRKQLTEDEIKNLTDTDRAKKTYLKKTRTGKYKSMTNQGSITPSTFSFSYRYRAYLVASNKKYITQKKESKKIVSLDNDDIDTKNSSSSTPIDLADIRFDIERLFMNKKITLLQYLLFFLKKDPGNFPEQYINTLTNIEECKKLLNERKKRNTTAYRESERHGQKMTNAEIAILLGCSESTVSRNVKSLEKVLNQISGIEEPELDEGNILALDDEKCRALDAEIADLEEKLENGKIKEELVGKFQKTLLYMKKKRDYVTRHMEIIELHNSGMKNKDIAEKLKVSKFVVSKNLSEK